MNKLHRYFNAHFASFPLSQLVNGHRPTLYTFIIGFVIPIGWSIGVFGDFIHKNNLFKPSLDSELTKIENPATSTGASKYVKLVATGDGSGSDWDNALGASDLETTIEAGGTVYVAAGTYLPGNRIDIVANVCVIGGFPDSATGTEVCTNYDPITNRSIIDGASTHELIRHYDNAADTIELRGLVLQNAVNSGAAFFSAITSTAPFKLSFIDLEVKNCTSTSHGAIFVEQKINVNTEILFKNCNFRLNDANRGGAISLKNVRNSDSNSYANPGKLVIEDCVFFTNTALSTGGGALYMEDANQWTLSRNIFCSNNGSLGGAIRIATAYKTEILDCEFGSNSSTVDGGAIYANDGDLTINNAVFLNNNGGTTDRGGAIYGTSNSGIQVDSSNFYNNYAGSGGAIYWTSALSVATSNQATNSIFVNNAANQNNSGLQRGGGAIKGTDADWIIRNNFFVDNSVAVSAFGGAINIHDLDAELTNNLFYNNQKGTDATILGADIITYSSLGSFSPAAGNKMQLSSAAIYVAQTGTPEVNDYDFTTDTFSNTDDGSLTAAPSITCATDIGTPNPPTGCPVPEICGNGIDDDLDGFMDTADADCNCVSNINCTQEITGADAGSYTLNPGDTLCISPGASFTGTITLQGGALINCADNSQTFSINWSTIATQSYFENNGDVIMTTYSNVVDGIMVNSGSIQVANEWRFNADTDVTNHGTITTLDDIVINNSGGSFNNLGTLNVAENFRGQNASNFVNSGVVDADRMTMFGNWTNSGSMTFPSSCVLYDSSIGTIDGGCISCSVFDSNADINGINCGNINVSTISTIGLLGSLTGDIALVDATPPTSAPFIDNPNGTIDPTIQWASCVYCSPEICGNGIDDNNDGRIDEGYPGGVQTNLQLWLDAEKGTNTTANGIEVTSWADQSINAYSANADASSTDNPVYSTAAINYNPGIEFDGDYTDDFSDGLHLGSDYIFSTNEGLHVFAVVDPNVDSETDNYVFDFGLAAHVGYGMIYSNDDYGFYSNTSAGGTNNELLHTEGDEPALIEFEVDFDDFHAFNRNGTTLSSQVISLSQLTANEIGEDFEYNLAGGAEQHLGPFSIGRKSASVYLSNDGGRMFDGQIAEFIVYNDTLSAIDKQKINTYLSVKYGLTLPHDYVSSNGTTIKDITDGYTNDIAGIGVDSCGGLNQKQSKSISPEAIVTIGLGTIASTNQANTNSFENDNQFLVWGHDGAPENTNWNGATIDISGGEYERIDRLWKMEENVGQTQFFQIAIDVDDPDFDLPAMPAFTDGNYYLIYDDDGDFTNGGSSTPFSFSLLSGSEYSLISTNFQDSYFTIAIKINDEICNNGLDDDGDGDTDCQDADCQTEYNVSSVVTNNGTSNAVNIVGAPDGAVAGMNDGEGLTIDLGNVLDVGKIFTIRFENVANSSLVIEESIDGVNFFPNSASPYTTPIASTTDVDFTTTHHTKYLRFSNTTSLGIGVVNIDAITFNNCVCIPSTTMTEEYRINGGAFVEDSIINANLGDNLFINFAGTFFEEWAFIWSGPNSFYQVNDSAPDGVARDILLLNNVQANQAGTYNVFYFDSLGCVDSTSFIVNVLVPEICDNGLDDDGDGDTDCQDNDCTTSYSATAQTSVGVINPDNALGATDDVFANINPGDTMIIDLGIFLDTPYGYFIRGIGTDILLTVEESIDGINFFTNGASPHAWNSSFASSRVFNTDVHTRYLRLTVAESAPGGSFALDAIFNLNCACTPATTPVPEYQINYITSIASNNVDVVKGSVLRLEFVGNSFDTWTFIWSGPNSYYQVRDAGTNRDRIVLSDIQPDQAGEYNVFYFDDSGCADSTNFTVTVLTPEICNNGIDDDGDGDIDCADGDCPGLDTDGDSICDYFDLDDDNDGIPDVEEGHCEVYGFGFESDKEGWMQDNTNNGSQEAHTVHSSTVFTSEACNMSNIPANPDGNFIMADDTYGNQMHFESPDNLNVDLSSKLDGELSFNWIGGTYDGITGTQSPAVGSMDVFLNGGGVTINATFDVTGLSNAGVWTTFTFTLDDATWSGTATDLTTVLADFDRIEIEVESITAKDWSVSDCTNGEYFGLGNIAFSCASRDTDNDLVADYLDLDSDNDGIFDLDEAGHNEADANDDGIIDGAASTFSINGLFDSLETANDGVITYSISNSETTPDGNYDAYELDADGDGCFDTEEEAITDGDNDGLAGTGVPTVDPATGLVNGITYASPSYNNWQNPLIGLCLPEICNDGIDNDADGLVDCYDCGDCAGFASCSDNDIDGVSDICDLDDDNDGILDIDEGCRSDSVDISLAAGSTQTLTIDSGEDGFVLDVMRLDNSFNITVNDLLLTSRPSNPGLTDINFTEIFSTTGLTAMFADGDEYGLGGIPRIWTIGPSDPETPLLRMIIYANGGMELFGSKTLNGPLEKMILTGGLIYHPPTWSLDSNTIVVGQYLDGGTSMTASVYGFRSDCIDTDLDGDTDNFDLDSDGDGCLDTQEEGVIDPDNDGIAGTGVPTVDSVGLVSTITYITPPNNIWQDSLVGPCLIEICGDGIDNDADGQTDGADTDCCGAQAPTLQKK